jgi:hypothetical protein
MMLFALVLNQTNRIWHSLQFSRGRGTNWLRFDAELLSIRWWCYSMPVEEMEVEDWVDSLPSSSSSAASCNGGRGARVLLARELAGLRRRLATAARRWSPRAAVAGHGRRAGEAHERRWRGRGGCGWVGARGCLRRRLGLGAKQQVCEWVVESNRSDRTYSDKCASGWLKSPPGEILVLAGGLSWRPA